MLQSISLKSVSRLCLGLAAGAGLLLGAGRAHAVNLVAPSSHSYTDGDTWGNDNIGMQYDWSGSNIQYPQMGGDRNMFSISTNSFISVGRLFGVAFIPLYARAEGRGEHYAQTAPEYRHTEIMTAILAGNTLVNTTKVNVPCKPNQTQLGCSTFDKSISKTFVSGSATFPIGVIPVTVDGSVSGSMHGGIAATAWSMTDNLIPGSLLGRSFANLTAGASVDVHTSASAGIPYVVQVGIGADVTLLAVSTGPSMTASMYADPGANTLHGSYTWNNGDTIDVTTMSATVRVFAKLFGATVGSTDLVSTTGYNWNGVWVADKGSTVF